MGSECHREVKVPHPLAGEEWSSVGCPMLRTKAGPKELYGALIEDIVVITSPYLTLLQIGRERRVCVT